MPPVAPKKAEPEDIFAGTGAGKGGSIFPHDAEAVASIAESPGRGFARKLIRLLFFALGAAVIVIAGYFGYQYFLASKPQQPPSAEIPTTNNQIPNNNENVNLPVMNENANLNIPPENVNIVPPVEQPALAPQDDPNSIVDTDGDGLSDYQEVHIYRTDSSQFDTDNDGLSDRDEALTWNTDPNNPDTDGDGYKDGDEVTNGYNPLGPGKLLPPTVR